MRAIIQTLVNQALHALQVSGSVPLESFDVRVNYCKHRHHGDYTTHLPLLLAKRCGQPAQQIAAQLMRCIPPHAAIEHMNVGGAGCVNFFISAGAKREVISNLLHSGEEFGDKPVFNPVQFEPSAEAMNTIVYAQERITGVLGQLRARGFVDDESLGIQHLHELIEPQEQALLDLLYRHTDTFETVFAVGELQQLVYFLQDLATGLHRYYNAVTLLCEPDGLRQARLCLLKAVRQVIHNGLTLLSRPSVENYRSASNTLSTGS